MNDLEFIAEIDKRINAVNEAMARDVLFLEKNTKIKKDSKEYNKELKLIIDRYAPVMALMLKERDEAYEREAKKQSDEYYAQYEDSSKDIKNAQLDENGRPIGYIWKDGTWEKRKPKNKQ